LPNEDKKALVRSLVKSVIMVRPRKNQVQVKVVWVSGHYTNLLLQPPILISLDPMDKQALAQRIQQLWEEGLSDKEIAGVLQREGFRSARSSQVSPLLVQEIRLDNNWKSALERSKHADEVDGMFTVRGLARHLGVRNNWVYNRIRSGVIPPTCIQRHPQGKVHLLPKDGEYIERLKALITAKSDH
jgi:hypothetical protein